jgi:ribosome-associated protein
VTSLDKAFAVEREKVRPLSVEGLPHAHWVVLDYDDVVVHVFFEAAREFYRLERNWVDAQEVELPEPIRSQAKDLRLSAASATG